MPEHAWGIDIGDGTLKAVRLKRQTRGFLVVEVVEIPYLDPFLKKKSPPATIDRRAVAALYQFGSTVTIHDTDRVTLGFPSFHAMEGTYVIPRVEGPQLRDMIQYEVQSRVEGELDEIMISSVIRRPRSADMMSVFIHAVRRDEFNAFLQCLQESRIAFDRVVSSGQALVDMVQLCLPGGDDYLVFSPGFNATLMVIISKHDFWTRTLPIGLPVAPSEKIEVARDKVAELARVLKTEFETFSKGLFGSKGFLPSKVLVSGEGARTPSFINALDVQLDAPVEVLRSFTRLSLARRRDRELPPQEVVLSMGKAIGLAAAELSEAGEGITLAGSPASRRALRRLPVITGICGIILLLVLGLWGLEHLDSGRLGEVESALNTLKPEYPAKELLSMQHRIDRLGEEIEEMLEVHESRKRLINVSTLLTRLEGRSSRDTFGDFHMEVLDMDFAEAKSLKTVVATRLGSGQEIIDEMIALFRFSREDPTVEGPLAAEEETPPEGMAPLVLYRIEGTMK
jgi:Tfp pilus assembly PilM family ATPase